MQETQEMGVQSLGGEDSLEEEMATHSRILAWKILRTEEPGGLQSTGSQTVGRDRVTKDIPKVNNSPKAPGSLVAKRRLSRESVSWGPQYAS